MFFLGNFYRDCAAAFAAQLAAAHQAAVCSFKTFHGENRSFFDDDVAGQPTAVADEATQAAYIADYLNAWSQIPYAGPSFIYEMRDIDTDSGFVDYTFGVVRDDWTYKPSTYTMALWAATHPQLTSVEVIL